MSEPNCAWCRDEETKICDAHLPKQLLPAPVSQDDFPKGPFKRLQDLKGGIDPECLPNDAYAAQGGKAAVNELLTMKMQQVVKLREEIDGLKLVIDAKETLIENQKDHVNQVYAERNKLVCALSKLFPSWLGKHKDVPGEQWDEDWRWIVFIHPEQCGQMSWHIHDDDLVIFNHLFREPEHRPLFDNLGAPWDGHTTEEKYQRLAKLE